MNTTLKLVCTLMFFLPFILMGHTATITGAIRDTSTGEPLIGVNIRVSENRGTVSVTEGNFKISVEPGSYLLEASYLGYVKYSQNVTLAAGETKVLNLNLKAEASQLQIVTVSGSKYERNFSEETVSIEVLKSSQLENSNIITLNEGMDKIAGVVVTDNQATIRGGSGYAFGVGSRVLMIIDDIPMLSIDRSEIRWNAIPIEIVSQVEVLKSASSALYGASALNGVINVRTAFAKEKPETEVLVYSTFYDSPRRESIKWWRDENINYPIRYGGYVTHKQRYGAHDVVFGVNFNKSTGFIRLLDTGYRRVVAKYRFRPQKVKGLAVGMSANLMESEEADYFFWEGYDSSAYIPFGSENSRDRGTMILQKRRTVMLDPWVTYLRNNNHHTFRNRFYYTNLKFTGDQLKSYDWYSEYQFQRTFAFGLTVTAGIVGKFSRLLYEDLYGNKNVNSVAPYAQLDYRYKRFIFNLGGRYEYYNVDSFNEGRPVGSAGINFTASKSTWIRASASQGFRIPSLTEKYAEASLDDKIKLLPNTALKPEYGINAELGIKQAVKISKWMGYADLSFFWMEYWDMVEFEFGFFENEYNPPEKDLGLRANNISRARIAGYEISLIGEGNIGKIPVRVQSGYTYNYGVDLNNDTTLVNVRNFQKLFFESMFNKDDSTVLAAMLKYRYRHTVKFDLEFDLWHFTIGTELRYYSPIEKMDPIFEFIIPDIAEYQDLQDNGTVVYNQRISYDFKKFGKVSFIVNNVANKEYAIRPARMDAPRNFTVQYKVII